MKGFFHITLVIACAHAASISLQEDLAPDQIDTELEGSFQDALETSIVNLATSEDEMVEDIPTMEEMKEQNAQAMARIKDMLEKLKAGKAMTVKTESSQSEKLKSVEAVTDKRSSLEKLKEANDQKAAKIRAILKKLKGGKAQVVKMPQAQQKLTREQISARNNAIKAKFREMMKRFAANRKLAGKNKLLRAEKKDKNEFYMPVKRQIPTAEMDQFVEKLSPGCGKSFVDMQAGKGGLHTFGSARGVPANAEGCDKLGGKMCFTDASISKSGKSGEMMRKMMSTTSSSGNSCLPSQCVSMADLTNVANFMRGQALAIIPGNAHQIKLDVDCTKSGGDSVTVGDSDNSGSAVSAPTTMVLAAVLVVSQYAFMGW